MEFGLRARLSALISALLAVSLGVVVWLSVSTTRVNLEAKAAVEIHQSLTLAARRVESFLEAPPSDLRFLNGTPPIKGIVRARAGGGIDPLDQSTLELWRKRLDTIFREFASAKAHYLRLRYVDENGTELVHVWRDDQGVHSSTLAGGRSDPEAEPALARTLTTPASSMHVSPLHPAARSPDDSGVGPTVVQYGLPIHDEAAQLRGALLVDVALGPMLSELRRADGDRFVAVESGAFALHPDPARTWGSATLDEQFPSIQAHLDGDLGGNLDVDGVGALLHVPVHFDATDPQRSWTLAETREHDALLSADATRQLSAFRNRLLAILVIVLAIGAWASSVFTRRIVRPLRGAIAVATEIAGGDLPDHPLPVQTHDEVGALAASINQMIEGLRALEDQANAIAEGRLRASEVEARIDEGMPLSQAVAFSSESGRGVGGQLGRAFGKMESALRQLTVQARVVATGDLAASMLTEKREGELGTAFSAMIGQLQSIVRRIDDIARQVRDSAARMAEASDQTRTLSSALLADAVAQAEVTHRASASVGELRASIKTTADKASDADDLAADTARHAKQARASVEAATESMHLLQESAVEIGAIAHTIARIAHRTNLLALNAEIEAERSREHGRGFRVIATEIRALAGNNAESLQEIHELIDRSRTRINEVVRRSDEVAEVLDAIVKSVRTTSHAVQGISMAAPQQLKAANEVAAAVRGAAERATRAEEAATEANAMGRSLTKQGERLAEEAGELTAAISEFRL